MLQFPKVKSVVIIVVIRSKRFSVVLMVCYFDIFDIDISSFSVLSNNIHAFLRGHSSYSFSCVKCFLFCYFRQHIILFSHNIFITCRIIYFAYYYFTICYLWSARIVFLPFVCVLCSCRRACSSRRARSSRRSNRPNAHS